MKSPNLKAEDLRLGTVWNCSYYYYFKEGVKEELAVKIQIIDPNSLKEKFYSPHVFQILDGKKANKYDGAPLLFFQEYCWPVEQMKPIKQKCAKCLELKII